MPIIPQAAEEQPRLSSESLQTVHPVQVWYGVSRRVITKQPLTVTKESETGFWVSLKDFDELRVEYVRLLLNFTVAQTENNRLHQRDSGLAPSLDGR